MALEELRRMYSSVNDQPRILIGDFNKVKRQNDRSDPSSFDSSAADDFNKCLEDIVIKILWKL